MKWKRDVEAGIRVPNISGSLRKQPYRKPVCTQLGECHAGLRTTGLLETNLWEELLGPQLATKVLLTAHAETTEKAKQPSATRQSYNHSNAFQNQRPFENQNTISSRLV